MPRFLVTYVIPEQHHKRIVELPSPEIAAKLVKDATTNADNINVEELGNNDECTANLEVYQWCSECDLPIWTSDSDDSYLGCDDPKNSFVHTACAEARKKVL